MAFHKRAQGKRLSTNPRGSNSALPAYQHRLSIAGQLLQKLVSYFNGNAVGLLLTASVFLAVSTGSVKVFSFFYERGKVSYWSMDTSAIPVFGSHVILEILFCALFFTFFLFITGIFVISLPGRPPQTFGWWLLVLIYSALLCFVSALLYVFLFGFHFNQRVFLVPLTNLMAAIGIRFLIYTPKRPSSFPAQAVGTVILCLLPVILMPVLYRLGLDSAKSQRTFPLLNDTQVVVYATPTTYYTAQYTIDGDTILIDTRHQGTYARADDEVEYYTFEEVVLPD